MVRALAVAAVVSSAAVAQEAPAPAPAAQRLTLEAAVQLSLQRNPDLVKQVLQRLSSEQDLVIARSAILPQLNFNASLADTRVNGPVLISGTTLPTQGTTYSGNYSATLSVRQVVFDGGKWWNNLAAADLGQQASQAQVDEEKLQITYLVEQRFYELLRAQRQLNVLADAAARSRDQADFTQRLFEGGRSTQAEIYAARANRDNDEVQRLGGERAVELAREDLAAAVGIDPGEPLVVAEPANLLSEPTQPPGLHEAVVRALETRPSLKAFALSAESNRKAAAAARGDYWPAVGLFAQVVRGTQSFATFRDRPDLNSQASVGVNISWNIFNGFTTGANARKADLNTMIAENDLSSARRSVASDVDKAVAQLSTARAQSRVAQQAEQTAKEGLRLARTRQEVGVGTQLEVRDAELKLTQAQLSVVGSLVDGREAEAALRRAQGG